MDAGSAEGWEPKNRQVEAIVDCTARLLWRDGSVFFDVQHIPAPFDPRRRIWFLINWF